MDDTPAKLCFNATPASSKKSYLCFEEIYFIKLNLDEKTNNIIIICYDTNELEKKRYEINISKFDLNCFNKIFKMYDKIDEIFELVYQIFELNKFKITNPK